MKTKSLEERIQRIEDIHEVTNLVDTYEFKLVGGQYDDVVELFAKKTPGVRAEIGEWGVYEGTQGIKRLFGRGGLHESMQGNPETGMTPGVLFAQMNSTPVIEIAGDGKTAKGLWYAFGHSTFPVEGKPEPQAHWVMSKRVYDFVKEDGKWKIWHYKVYGIFYAPYDKGWVDVADTASKSHKDAFPEHLRADSPCTYHWVYSPSSAVEYVPKVPEPYETFDETFSY
ncbi:MAG: nuclear transport factor 2 family protein [Dehalococcoidia bacterium]|jgi:hypothetical protein